MDNCLTNIIESNAIIGGTPALHLKLSFIHGEAEIQKNAFINAKNEDTFDFIFEEHDNDENIFVFFNDNFRLRSGPRNSTCFKSFNATNFCQHSQPKGMITIHLKFSYDLDVR